MVRPPTQRALAGSSRLIARLRGRLRQCDKEIRELKAELEAAREGAVVLRRNLDEAVNDGATANEREQYRLIVKTYERLGTSRPARVPCDLCTAALNEALAYLGQSRQYTLTVHDSDDAFLDARMVLKGWGEQHGDLLVGRINLVLDHSFKRYDWRLTGNDRCYFCPDSG